MEIKIIEFLFVGFISLLVSFLTSKLTYLSEKNKIKRDFSKVLLEKRLEFYPELCSIISDIHWLKKYSYYWKDSIIINSDIRKKMRIWRKENWFYLSKNHIKLVFKSIVWNTESISISTLEAYSHLENALFLKEKYSSYSKEKILKIDKYRNVLMTLIQQEIWIMADFDYKLKINETNNHYPIISLKVEF